MDKEGFKIMRRLISDIDGAPYPNTVNDELYTIWYEHVQCIAQEALEYLNERGLAMDPDQQEIDV
jgi:hypothetical protein